jgi:hypothetical protein
VIAMPDTMIQTETSPVLIPASCGVMDGYRSASIGKLVAARAKASTKIKAIVKDKQAKVESRKEGGRSYSYQYADLADVLEAIEEAISEQGLAIFQTTMDRGRDGTFLITTLAHESDQWIAAEIRLKSTDAGPQIFGSEMTYLRRYAVLAALALAPEADDDGKTAQDRADQSRRSLVQRVERLARTETPSTSQANRQPSDESGAPVLMQIDRGKDGLLIGRWVTAAKNVLDGKPEDWRRNWLELHGVELEEVRRVSAEWADKLESIAIAPEVAA